MSYCLRDSILEDVHSGSRILDNDTMKELMQEVTQKMVDLLQFKEDHPVLYAKFLIVQEVFTTMSWDRQNPNYDTINELIRDSNGLFRYLKRLTENQ